MSGKSVLGRGLTPSCPVIWQVLRKGGFFSAILTKSNRTKTSPANILLKASCKNLPSPLPKRE